MTEQPVSGPVVQTVPAPEPPITSTLVVYALFGVAAVGALLTSHFPVATPLFSVLGVIGVVIAYVKRDEAQGTWVASHLRWLIRTFWYSLLWSLIGWIVFVVLAIVLVGLLLGPLILAAAAIWVIYRVVRGYLLFKDNRPVPGM